MKQTLVDTLAAVEDVGMELLGLTSIAAGVMQSYSGDLLKDPV
jgi:hypothetical protein